MLYEESISRHNFSNYRSDLVKLINYYEKLFTVDKEEVVKVTRKTCF